MREIVFVVSQNSNKVNEKTHVTEMRKVSRIRTRPRRLTIIVNLLGLVLILDTFLISVTWVFGKGNDNCISNNNGKNTTISFK